MTEPAENAPIALTMGEPAGIGGDIALMAWLRRDEGIPPFVLIDDPDRLRRVARAIGADVEPVSVASLQEGRSVFDKALPVLPHPVDVEVEPGIPAAATTVIQSIDRAVELALAGEASAVVTNPIHKEALYRAGFGHPGHTEYLAEKSGAENGSVMMLASAMLRVVPVTIHLSLREAIAALTADEIVRCGEVTADALVSDFGVTDPVISVAGLNPHAGESGSMGREEIDIIEPAITRLRDKGLRIEGPLPADTLFHEDARASYHAVLCMYHDQALIPLKTLDFHGGVNVTLGLPIVRTSPDHGTAFDIAWTGKANPSSLMAALRMAADIAERRRAFDTRRGLA